MRASTSRAALVGGSRAAPRRGRALRALRQAPGSRRRAALSSSACWFSASCSRSAAALRSALGLGELRQQRAPPRLDLVRRVGQRLLLALGLGSRRSPSEAIWRSRILGARPSSCGARLAIAASRRLRALGLAPQPSCAARASASVARSRGDGAAARSNAACSSPRSGAAASRVLGRIEGRGRLGLAFGDAAHGDSPSAARRLRQLACRLLGLAPARRGLRRERAEHRARRAAPRARPRPRRAPPLRLRPAPLRRARSLRVAATASASSSARRFFCARRWAAAVGASAAAMKPSQRHSAPSRLTSRWPGFELGLQARRRRRRSTTPICARRRASSARRLRPARQARATPSGSAGSASSGRQLAPMGRRAAVERRVEVFAERGAQRGLEAALPTLICSSTAGNSPPRGGVEDPGQRARLGLDAGRARPWPRPPVAGAAASSARAACTAFSAAMAPVRRSAGPLQPARPPAASRPDRRGRRCAGRYPRSRDRLRRAAR